MYIVYGLMRVHVVNKVFEFHHAAVRRAGHTVQQTQASTSYQHRVVPVGCTALRTSTTDSLIVDRKNIRGLSVYAGPVFAYRTRIEPTYKITGLDGPPDKSETNNTGPGQHWCPARPGPV